jgi:hypothetical protein
MRLMNDCIERAAHFQALAEAETDPRLRAQLIDQAKAYLRLAGKRAKELCRRRVCRRDGRNKAASLRRTMDKPCLCAESGVGTQGLGGPSDGPINTDRAQLPQVWGAYDVRAARERQGPPILAMLGLRAARSDQVRSSAGMVEGRARAPEKTP